MKKGYALLRDYEHADAARSDEDISRQAIGEEGFAPSTCATF